MKYFFFFIFFVSSNTHAQTVAFKEIKLKPQAKFYNVNDLTIIYPIVVTKNAGVDKLINNKIKEEILGPDDGNINTAKALNDRISEGLINLSYEVTFKKNGILSMYISGEGCGAYCSSWNIYFNFDLKTGKEVSITDLIFENKIDSFRTMVFADKVKALNTYKEEEKEFLKNGIDSSTLNWALEQVDSNCINDVQIQQFSLSDNGIEIIDPCEFPHAIRSQQPIYELKYSYKVIYTFLTQKFQLLLSK